MKHKYISSSLSALALLGAVVAVTMLSQQASASETGGCFWNTNEQGQTYCHRDKFACPPTTSHCNSACACVADNDPG